MAAGLLAVDPEELLWRPTKKIFIPSPKKIIEPAYGLSIKLLRAYDIDHKFVSRLDAYLPWIMAAPK